MSNGTVVAGYRLESVIGRGGMGEVYRAVDTRLGRTVAVKLIAPELLASADMRRRFVEESRLAAALDHPHIVPIYEAGEADGRLFIAMRYVEGHDLEQLIADGPLEPRRAITMLRGVADALDEAHARELIHRDVKPGNILVASAGRGQEHAYLGDFGLTKRIGSAGVPTRSGQLVGSVDYMAPEQIEGRSIDGRVDVYSLACVLYACLTGTPPFLRDREIATLWAHVHAPPPKPSELRRELRLLDPVLARGMAKDPDARFATARELIDEAAVVVEAGRGVTHGFVFADLRGYTAFVDRQGATAGAELLARYRALVRDAMRAHNGAEIRTEGDSFYILFQSAGDAIRGAFTIAEGAGSATRQQPAAPIAVAIGVHAGETVETSEGHVGSVVNIAARICAEAVGGQILVSDTVRGLVRSVVAAQWVSRGRRRLKGIDDRIEVFSIHAADASVRDIERADVALPYVGLRPFDEADASFYVGRERDVDAILARLARERFLAVFGASGSGKSSLVRAGLVPALRNGALPGSASWAIDIVRPGEQPLEALAAGLARIRPQAAWDLAVDDLVRDGSALHRATEVALTDRDPSSRLVWVIDQAEELFTLCSEEAIRRAAIDNLLHAATVAGGRTVVILAMRADFYHRCAAYRGLAELVADSQYLVSPLDADSLRRTVDEPARLVGLEFETGLVDRIVADVVARPGALPLLEHALLELWNRREGSMLTLAGYHESGGIEGAIAVRAEATYAQLDGTERERARRIFLRLVQPGDGTEDTRRRAGVSELAESSGTDASDRVTGVLSDARLLTLGSAEDTSEPVVDIAHEALLTSWPRLRAWIDADRDALRVARRVGATAAEWERAARDRDELLRGPRLAEASELLRNGGATLTASERAFVESSEVEATRRTRERERRQRVIVGASLGVAAFFVALSGLAAMLWMRSEDERLDADAARARAEARRVEAVGGQIVAQSLATRSDLGLSALLAVEGAGRFGSPEALQNLSDLLQERPEFVTFHPFDGSVAELAASPSGDMLAVLTIHDSAVELEPELRLSVWDVSTWTRLFGEHRVPDARTTSPVAPHRAHIAFSPDGRQLAFLEVGAVAVLDVSTGSVVRDPSLDAGPVETLAWTSEGRVLRFIARATPDAPPTLWSWAPDSGAASSIDLTADTVLDSEPMLREAFVVPGASFAIVQTLSGTGFGLLHLFDAETGEMIREADGELLGFGVDGDSIVVVNETGLAVLSLPEIDALGAPYRVPPGRPWFAEFDPEAGTVRVWTPGRTATVSTLDGSILREAVDDSAAAEALAAGGDMRFVARDDGMIAVINVHPDQRLDAAPTVLRPHDLAPAVLSQDAVMLATWEEGGGARTIVVEELASGRVVGEATPEEGTDISVAAFSADGTSILTVHESGRSWSTRLAGGPGQVVGALGNIEEGTAFSLAVSTSGTLAVVDSMSVRVLEPGAEMRVLPGGGSAADFLPDGSTLVVASCSSPETGSRLETRFEVLDTRTGAVTAQASAPDCAAHFDVSGDGRTLVALHSGNDVSTTMAVYSLPGFTRLGSIDLDETPPRAIRLEEATGWTTAVTVAGEIRTWYIDPETWRQLACNLAGRNLTRREWARYVGDEPYGVTCEQFPAEPEAPPSGAPPEASPAATGP